MKRILVVCCLVFLLGMVGCGESKTEELVADTQTSVSEIDVGDTVLEQENETNQESEAVEKMNVQIGDKTFTATLESNEAADAFVQIMQEAPIVIEMRDYSGFEKVGDLGQRINAKTTQMTTESGDIVLYSGNQIVMFYGSNSWSYAKIGKVDDLTGWEEALGTGDVTVTFSID